LRGSCASHMPLPSKRPRLPPGGGALDSILTGVTSLHSSLGDPAARSRRAAAAAADLDVAALQGFLRPEARPHPGSMGPPPPPGTVEPCRNPQCPGRGLKPSFEEDRRKGDRICLHCGATSRCRPEEEEHRSFADDDGKSEKRKRAEVLAPGRAGARVGDKNLAQAVALANSGAESEHSDLGKVEQKRLKGYNDKIASLLSHQFSQAHTGMSREVQDAAHSLADKLVRSQAEHDTHCEKVQLSEQLKKAGDADGAQRCKCRLSQKPKNHAVVAAVLLMHAEREHGTTHQFQEVATLLQGDAQSRDVSMADVGKIEKLVKHRLMVSVCEACFRASIGKIEKLVKELLSLGAIRREVDGGFGKYPCAAEPGFKLRDGETAAREPRSGRSPPTSPPHLPVSGSTEPRSGRSPQISPVSPRIWQHGA